MVGHSINDARVLSFDESDAVYRMPFFGDRNLLVPARMPLLGHGASPYFTWTNNYFVRLSLVANRGSVTSDDSRAFISWERDNVLRLPM